MAGAPKRGDQKMENGLKYRWTGKKWVRDHSWGGIKKKTTSNSKTNTPPPTKPKRSDYAAGSYGQGKFNVALAKWNSSNNKTTTKTTKSVSKEVQKQIDSNEAAKNQYKNDPAGYFGTKLTIGDKKKDNSSNQSSSNQNNSTEKNKPNGTNTGENKQENKQGKSVESDKPAEKLKVKPKKMSQLEKENRARFGNEAINHLQKKHKDFKKMQSGEMTKQKFIELYPNSITARESNKGRRRK